ncbi:MAG TPA: hypothetical protein DGC76_11365, partial [Candidatus Accumulibacter sp.]|nr:hypothetical protein [Accumulibacter sp.]
MSRPQDREGRSPPAAANPFDDSAATWDSDPLKGARALAVGEAIRQRVPTDGATRGLESGWGTRLLSVP